jgi:transposase InsO family protein
LDKLERRASLRGLKQPSEASIGRYLHQWSRFRRRPKQKGSEQRLHQPTAVHQRWQVDFKVKIALKDGTVVNLHSVRDPVGEAYIGAFVFPAGQVGGPTRRVKLENVRWALRICFANWGTLPDEIQTDGEPVLIGRAGAHFFPSRFTLWLKGLGIDHLVIRSGKPTDNAEVERCHRTVNDYAIVGNEKASPAQLQGILDQAVHELNFELSSRAAGCGGLPPVIAHPELLQPRTDFQPELELALFDLQRVDQYLATFTWQRIVGKTGQVYIGQRRPYTVGRTYARQEVLVRFDPNDRHFVFFATHDSERELGRRPARGLDVTDLTGIAPWPVGLGPQQLFLPLKMPQGVNC